MYNFFLLNAILVLQMSTGTIHSAARAASEVAGASKYLVAPDLRDLSTGDDGGMRRRGATASTGGAVIGVSKAIETHGYFVRAPQGYTTLLCPSRHVAMEVFLKPFAPCADCKKRLMGDPPENVHNLVQLIEDSEVDDRVEEHVRHFLNSIYDVSRGLRANVRACFISGATLLMLCMEKGKNVFAAELLRAGADYKACDLRGDTALHYAVRANNEQGVRQLLLMPGIDINFANNAGVTPLREAFFVRPQNNNIIGLLVRAGARETAAFLCCCCSYVPSEECGELCCKTISRHSCCIASTVLSGLVGLFCGLRLS